MVGANTGLMLAWAYTPAGAEEPCYFVDVEKISEETLVQTRDALVSQGWYSDTTDNLEALYSPSCEISQRIERQALLEEVKALRGEVDALRVEVRQLLDVIEGVIDGVASFRL